MKKHSAIKSLLAILLCSSLSPAVSAETSHPQPVREYQKIINSLPDSYATQILTTKDNGLIIAGNTNVHHGKGQNFLVKMDKNQKLIWQSVYKNQYADQRIDHVWPLADGGYMIAGRLTQSSAKASYSNVYVRKVDASGAKVWETLFSSASDDEIYTMEPAKNGNYRFVGGRDVTDKPHTLFEWELDSKGKKVQEYSLNNHLYGSMYDALRTEDGGYLILGSIALHEIHLTKLGPTGQKVWEKSFPSGKSQIAYSLVETKDHAFLLTGYRDVQGKGFDVLLMKVNQQGNLLEEYTFGNQDDNLGNIIKPATDGGFFILAESHELPNVDEQTYIIKLDPVGTKVGEWLVNNDSIADVQQAADGMNIACGRVDDAKDGHALLMELKRPGGK